MKKITNLINFIYIYVFIYLFFTICSAKMQTVFIPNFLLHMLKRSSSDFPNNCITSTFSSSLNPYDFTIGIPADIIIII